MRRPVHQLQSYWWTPENGQMAWEQDALETFQQPQQVSPSDGRQPVQININLADVLEGLGLKELIAEILAYRGKVAESPVKKVSSSKLLEAVVAGANPSDVATLLVTLFECGGLHD